MTGIYAIRNKMNNKRYIGQSLNIEKRFLTHKYSLRKGSHFNKHLQSAWNTYGESNFVFEIIEECLKTQLNDKETYWKQFYDPHTYNLGNTGNVGTVSEETKQQISNTVTNYVNSLTEYERKQKYGHKKNVGKVRSEECRKRISESLRGRPSYKRTADTLRKQSLHNTFRRYIFQFTKEGKFLKAWSSISDCRKEFIELDQAAISCCCMGTQKTTKGYTFRYANMEEIKLLELGYIPTLTIIS